MENVGAFDAPEPEGFDNDDAAQTEEQLAEEKAEKKTAVPTQTAAGRAKAAAAEAKGDPEPPSPEPDAEAEAKKTRERSGKFVVLYRSLEDDDGAWQQEVTGTGEEILREGDRVAAMAAALEADEELAADAREGKLEMNPVPASSWQPKSPAPRTVKTEWIFR